MSGKAYSMREMKSIVDYLTENKLYGETRGRKMWMDYANSKLTVRTWQSLKETFFKRVLPDITNPYYRLDPDQILSFKRGVDLTRKDKKLNFRPVDKANNDNGVSGDNDQPCSSKNNNEENATGCAAKSRRLGGRKRTISHHNMHSDSSEWTSTSDSEYVSPPRGRRNRYARKYLVDLTREDKKLDFRPVDKANNDNGVSGDNDQPCSSKNNNEENATGEDKKCSKILHDRASTETLILDTSYQTAEDIQRDLESTDEEQKREAAKNGSKSTIKSVRDLIEYTEPMLQEVLDDFATDEDCSDTERPMQIDENYVAQHEILIDGEEKIADDNIQSVKATDESAFSQLEDVMVLLDQALTKDVDQELSIRKEKQNKEANSFESSIPMTDSLLPNNQEAVKNTSTFGVHSPAQSTSNGEADEKKENMKEAQQDSKLLDASTNLISDEETDPKHSEAHIKTDCEEKTNNNETIDQNAAQNIKSPKELHVTDDEVHEIHSDSSASNKDVAAQVENPCLKSVNLYAEQLVTIKYSDSDSNNKENTNNELITKEVQKADETKENINQINAGTKCNEDLKNEKENSKGETTEGIILLNSWTTSESVDGSEMNHRPLARSSLKRQKDKKLASVFGFSNGSAAKSRRLGGRKRTISHHNMHSDSSEWTSTSDSEYVSPPRGRRNRYARKYLVDLTRKDKKLDFRPVDKANNDNGVSGDNDQPCSSKNNNEENATGEDKKCSKILHDRASTETLILDTSYQTAEDIQRDLESTDEEQKREAAKNGSKSKIKSVRDLIEYTEPMLQEVLDDFATDEDCSDTERPMQIDENYVAQHEILIDGEEKIADDNIQSVKATDESAFSQLEDVMVLLDQALTKDVDQELSIQKEKQNKEANSFESSIPMTDSLLPNNQEAVKNTSTFGVHSPAQSTSNGEADEKKENMKEAQQDSKLLDASTNLISDEETDPKRSEAHIKTDCEEKTNNNETIDQNAAQNIKSPKELHVTDDEVHEIHSDSSASNKDVAAQVENPCLKSVSLYAEQLVTIKYSDSDSNNKENTNNELITKEVQKDDETKENINQINAGTKCNEDLKNEKENSKGETTEGIILLNSWTTSESFDGSEMNHRPLARSSLKRQKDKKLASVFGFSNGCAAKSRRLGGRKRTISHHNMHSDSSEWTSTSDSEYVSPPRGRRNRYARKYLKPRSAQIMSLEEEGGLCVMLGKKIYPLVKDGKAVKNYVTFLPESDPEEDGSYWKSKYIEERKRTADLKKKLVHSKSNGVLQKEEKENSVSLSSLASPLNEDRPRQPPSRQSVAGNEIMGRETGLEKSNHGTLKFKYTKNDQAVQLEGHWRDINPVLAQVVSMLDKEPVEKKKPETVTCVELSSGNTTPIVSPPVTVSVAVDGRAGRGRPVSALARAQLAMSCTVRLERLRGDEAPHASHTSLATLHESRRASPSRMQETHDNTAGLRAEEAYTCDTCGEHFTGKSSLIAHVRVRTHCGLAQDDSAATGSSGTCSKQLSCESLFAKHTQAHTGQKLSYSCDMCTEQFRAKTVLIRHIGTHMDLKQYSCKVCNKMFKARSDLRRHVRIHTGVKPYSCGECNKQFSEKSNLESHKRIHTGVKPYRCEECNKQFRLKGDLNMHKRIHSGVKPYRCEQCHKRFTRKSDLDRHKKIHSGIKPYRCEECNKQFTRKSNLDRHKRIHAREKSFSCKECNKQNTK